MGKIIPKTLHKFQRPLFVAEMTLNADIYMITDLQLEGLVLTWATITWIIRQGQGNGWPTRFDFEMAEV